MCPPSACSRTSREPSGRILLYSSACSARFSPATSTPTQRNCSGRSRRTTKAERLRNIEAHLLNLLELIESKPGITGAADNLLQAARASRLVHDPARARLLREAFHRFQKRLAF